MPSSMAIAISTRGHVCRGPDAVTVVDSLVPTVNASSLEPVINTEGQKPPEFEMLAIEEQVPEVTAKGDTQPLFEISPVVDPVPSADTKEISDTPEVLIKPVVDLRPTITNKKDD